MFSEFAFGYAVVREIEHVSMLKGMHAPFFPTQQMERRVGYDVALNWSGHCWFIQFKRSAEMRGRRSPLRHVLGVPYFRFEVTRRSKSPQHDVLVNLARRVAKYGGEVRYCAPLFVRYASLDRHYQNSAVLMNSVFVDLLGGPYLPDDEQHYYNTDIMASRTIFTSEFQEEVKGQLALNAAARTLEAAALAPRIEASDALRILSGLRAAVLDAAKSLEGDEDVEMDVARLSESVSLQANDPLAIMRRIQNVALFALDLAWIPILRVSPSSIP